MTVSLLLLALLLPGAILADPRPNIIFFLADDLGWNDVSFHGSPQIETPNIDKLADLGITLNNYYVQPICTPSRGALMSGQYPIHTGLQHDVIAHGQPWGLPLQISILPQHLKDLGYATHAVGKWHLGFFHPDYTPTKRGFDSHYGYWCGAEDYVTHVAREPEGEGMDFRSGMDPVKTELGNYSTEIFTREAVRVVQDHNTSEPLFLYVAYQSVHSSQGSAPLQAPPKYVDRFPHIQDPKRRMFAGMVAAMDDSIGAILEALHSRGLLDNAVVAFSTDNGGPAGGFNLNQASNWPLRGVKYSLWEGGTRGSALVWSPLLSNQGRKSHQLMHVTDWLPTLYSAAGGNISTLGQLDGLSQWEALSSGKSGPRTEILLNIDPVWKMSALRVGPYKVISGDYDPQWSGWYGPAGSNDTSRYDVQCGPKGSTCNPVEAACLFNIEEDPCEMNNLADEKPQMVAEMLQRVAEYAKKAVPPLNKPFDPQANPALHGYFWSPWRDSPDM